MNITDLIQGAVASRTTRFAFELLPPLKGDGTRSVFGAIDPLMDFNPAYINVTFHREALKEDIRPDGSREWHIMRRRPGTVGISAAIRRKYDVEVVPHLICGGWSKYDIEDSLIDMDFLGLHNVLALRGDKRQNEPRFVPYAQGHAHAADLVRQIQAMNRGEFIDGEVEECHHSKFSVGVAGYPEKHFEAANAQSDLQYLKEKVDAGADYIVTQMFFDNNIFFNFMYRVREAGITVPIVPGIMPITRGVQVRNAVKLSGCNVPERFKNIVDRFGDNPEAMKQAGIVYATDQIIDLLANGVKHIHVYSMNKPDVAAGIQRNISEILKA